MVSAASPPRPSLRDHDLWIVEMRRWPDVSVVWLVEFPSCRCGVGGMWIRGRESSLRLRAGRTLLLSVRLERVVVWLRPRADVPVAGFPICRIEVRALRPHAVGDVVAGVALRRAAPSGVRLERAGAGRGRRR